MDAERWVALADDELCVGCRQCVRTCPFAAIEVDGPLAVTERVEADPGHPAVLIGDVSEVRPGFANWDEALAEADRCIACPDPTCVRGCPAHNDIPSFIRAVRDGDLSKAHNILRRTSVLPDICSRVCDQAAQCEGACTWSLAGGTPVAIGKLERFAADHATLPPPVRARVDGAAISVAVVGTGPAGIGAAWRLVEAGASVTVYDRDPAPGGLLNWGIPDFTLPAAVASRPWRQLVAAGVQLRCGAEIRPQDIDRLRTEHDAVILAHGAALPLRLPVPGGDLDAVTDAMPFLKAGKAALREGGGLARFCNFLSIPAPAEGGHKNGPPQVLVLGAGNTAMDVARTARRLGLHAVCVDWADERFAPGRPDELDEARREGAEIRFLRTLARLEGEEGRVRRAALARTRQARASLRPKLLGGNQETLDVDLVVMAMGCRNDPDFAAVLPGTPVPRVASGLADRRWAASGILAAAASAFAYHYPVGALALGREAALSAAALPIQDRLWVAGDALAGPSTVVEAMAQGQRAAASVLAAQPRRPGRARPSGPRQVLVCYEASGGRAAWAAKAVARAFFGNGDHVRVLPIAKTGPLEMAAADLVVVGSRVEGRTAAGVRPARAVRAWLADLPRLGGKPIAIFCTFAVAPRGTLPAMRRAVQAKGAVVIAQAAFGPRELGPEAGVFGPAAFGAELLLRSLPERAPGHLSNLSSTASASLRRGEVASVLSSHDYRPHVARAYARLYRPFQPAGRRRSKCDEVMARWWTHLDVAAYRHLGVSLGVKALGVNDVILLRTRGRRTGQVREVLVAYVELGGVPVVCGGNAGWERPPGWFQNLRDGGPVEIEYRDHRRMPVAPVILGGEARDQAFAVVCHAFPHIRLYLTRTTRPFPVVRLEPLDAQAAGDGTIQGSAALAREGAPST